MLPSSSHSLFFLSSYFRKYLFPLSHSFLLYARSITCSAHKLLLALVHVPPCPCFSLMSFSSCATNLWFSTHIYAENTRFISYHCAPQYFPSTLPLYNSTLYLQSGNHSEFLECNYLGVLFATSYLTIESYAIEKTSIPSFGLSLRYFRYCYCSSSYLPSCLFSPNLPTPPLSVSSAPLL